MKCVSLLAVAAGLLCCGLVGRGVSANVTAIKMNAIVDQIMEVMQDGPENECIALDNATHSIHVLLTTGSLNTTNGTLCGIENIFRSGDAIAYQNSTTTSTIVVELGFSELNYTSAFEVHLGLLRPQGKIQGKITHPFFTLTITANTTNISDVTCELKSTKITSMGEMTLTVKTDNGFTTLLENAVADVIKTWFKGSMKTAVEESMGATLGSIIKSRHFNMSG